MDRHCRATGGSRYDRTRAPLRVGFRCITAGKRGEERIWCAGLLARSCLALGQEAQVGCGQHGGLGAYEQSPVLMIEGAGFRAGTTRDEKAHIVDVAPTILRHLALTSA